ncbi:uncharacterized protein LOC130712859 [Lotus japonicus]|uniref:uncharacterized protein LOC130712859 n=1 Tax=Lotus japonicus TaxID=34305 RepID=UPI00258AB0A8|nr:uncharacterized protein LOC130712859 [Lotus japonicus]
MDSGLSRKIGEGNDVKFWSENWLGSGTLKDKFGRLFCLSTQQHHTVNQMGTWVNGSWLWELHWRRILLDRENIMVTELLNSISSCTLSEGVLDDWIWTKEEGGHFSVKSAYLLLQGEVSEPDNQCFRKLWAVKAPSNVLALAWKVFLNRIQSKVNLSRRGILLDPSQILCPFCAQAEETTTHLIFTCIHSWHVWHRVLQWLGISTVLPEEGKNHFLSFQDSYNARDRKKGMSFIWLSTVWFLWHLRNSIIFQGEVADFSLALDTIQFKSWLWLKGKAKGFYFSSYEWASNPLICLGSL